jgi:hypothetical protein
MKIIEGNQSNYKATIKGYQSNCGATIKKDIILYNTIIDNENTETSKLINRFSKCCKTIKKTTYTNW